MTTLPSIFTREFGLMHYLRSLNHLTYLAVSDPESVLQALGGAGWPVLKRTAWVCDDKRGLTPFKTFLAGGSDKRASLHPASSMKRILEDDPRSDINFYFIFNPERWFAEEAAVDQLHGLVRQLVEDNRIVKLVVFVGPPDVVPPESIRPFIVRIAEGETNHPRLPVPGADEELDLQGYFVRLGWDVDDAQSEAVAKLVEPFSVWEFERLLSSAVFCAKAGGAGWRERIVADIPAHFQEALDGWNRYNNWPA